MSAAVRFSPTPPAFRLIRNSGTSPRWKRRTGVDRSTVSPHQQHVALLFRRQPLTDERQHRGELREQQHPPPFVQKLGQQLHQPVELGRPHLRLLRRLQLQQPRIAARLAQLQQRVEDHDARPRQPVLGDRLADASAADLPRPYRLGSVSAGAAGGILVDGEASVSAGASIGGGGGVVAAAS